MKHSAGLFGAGVVTFASLFSFISLSLTPRRFCSLYRSLLCLFSVTILLLPQPRNNSTCSHASSCPLVQSKQKQNFWEWADFSDSLFAETVSRVCWNMEVWCVRTLMNSRIALSTRPMTHGSVATVTPSCWSRLHGRMKLTGTKAP